MSFDRLEHAGAALASALVADITSAANSFSLTVTTGWPTGAVGPFYAEIDSGTGSAEKVLVTTLSGGVCSGVTRGVDNTVPVAHSAGAAVIHLFAAVEADEANQTAHKTLGQIAAAGDLLIGAATKDLTVLTVGASGLPLVSNGTTLAYATVGTTGITNAAVTGAKMSADRRVVATNVAAVLTSKLRSDTTYADIITPAAITVPTWATKAIVSFHIENIIISSGVTAAVFKSVLDGISGAAHNYGPTGSVTDNGRTQVFSFKDEITGLSSGAVTTISVQVKGDGGSPGTTTLNFTSVPAWIEYDVEFLA